MIYGKEESQRLAQLRAAVLVHEGNTASGTPIFEIRTAVKAFGYRSGKGCSQWGIMLNESFSDDCEGVLFNCVLGVNTGTELKITELANFLDRQYSYLRKEERVMLISDAYVRLKEAK